MRTRTMNNIPDHNSFIITMKDRIYSIVLGLFASIVLVSMPFSSFAQERNEEVTIIAPFQPTISDALKMSFTPEIRPSDMPERSFQFQYLDKQLFAPLTLDPIAPQRYSRLSEDELLRNYVKAGFGNYMTPYLEFFAGSRRSEKYQVNARFKHLSSRGNVKDYGPSAYSHNHASVGGKVFTKDHTLAGKIDYQRDVYHFYGFQPDSFPSMDVEKDSIKQRFQLIGADVSFGSNYEDAKKFAHEIEIGFYNYSDKYETRENNFTAIVNLSKGFDLFRSYPPTVIGLELGMNYTGRKDTVATENPLIFGVKPWVGFDFDQYSLSIGVLVEAEKDSSTSVGIFPVIEGEVVIIEDQLKAFAELKGERVINSFRSLSTENPFIISNPEIRNSTVPIGFGGGVIGNISGFNYFAKAHYRYIKDMPLFVNDTSLVLLNRFEVIYDRVNEFSFEAGGGYEIPGVMHLGLTGIFYGYDTKEELKAWHKPSFKVTLDGSYTFLEKYTIEAAFFLIGPAYYKDYEAGNVITGKLTTSYDLNAGFKYQHNQYFSAFLNLNNILNQRYDLWYRYPCQGFQVMAGLGFSF